MLRSILTTASEVVGLGLITAGVAVVFWPAALVVAGVGFVAIGVMQA